MELKLKFVKDKETAGAFRFQESDSDGAPLAIADGAKVGTIYLRKSALKKGAKVNSLDVTIKVS